MAYCCLTKVIKNTQQLCYFVGVKNGPTLYVPINTIRWQVKLSYSRRFY